MDLVTEAKYRKLFMDSPDASLILVDGIFVDCNRAIEVMFRGTRSMIIGKGPEIISPEYQPDGETSLVASKKKISEALQKGLNIFDWVHKKFDGSEFFVEVSLAPTVFDDQPALYATCRDITERIQAKELLKHKNRELTLINAEKDKFFSIIAHDLRSPFTSFLGLTQIMAEQLPSLTMDEIQKIAVSMRNSASNLFSLLENLLQWSQIRRGVYCYNPTLFPLKKVVYGCLAMNTETAKSKNITINTRVEEQLMITGDEEMIATVVRNLVSNAVKFTHNNGEINITARQTDNDLVELSIQDNGIGMNSEMVENLFRLDAGINRKGTNGEPSTGLGLLLCKEFIDNHKGAIKVESTENEGSTFKIILPV